MPKLRECPFCDSSEVELVRYESARTYVRCLSCNAHGPSLHFGTPSPAPEHAEKCRAEAIAAWNRRSDPRLAMAREALAHLVEVADGASWAANIGTMDEAIAQARATLTALEAPDV